MSWSNKQFGGNMSIENMKTRLKYMGGNQQERMNKDKLKSLKKALLYSYQAATAILSDGREFRCLINSNKLSTDLDDKILSIPFEDACLNDSNTEIAKTNIKEGDIIEWKENGSHWLVFLQRLEETAYFRAELRRCRYEIALGNGKKYWGYIRGPIEQSMVWMQNSGNYMNKLNRTLNIFITQNKETLEYFHRFKKVFINDFPWEVQAVDDMSTPGIIEIALKEDFSNTPRDDIEKAVQDSINIDIVDTKEETYIHGLSEVYPYDTKSYEIKNYEGPAGSWFIENESREKMIKLSDLSSEKVTINIVTGRSGKFTLAYKADNHVVAALDIEIKSL